MSGKFIIYYTELKDYAKAADAFARGASVPDAHPFLRIMAAQMARHAGEFQMARMMWTTAYESTRDRNVRANALTHLRALQVDEDVTILEKLIATYRERTGRSPSSFSDLQAAGLLQSLPVDPFGHAYKLVQPERVEVRNPDEFPFIEKGTPPGYVSPPPKFRPSDMGGAP
jgi:hypothetical protein